MNIIFPTTIVFTLALIHSGQGVFLSGNTMTSNLASPQNKPCWERSNNDAYKEFARKHILREKDEFNRKSEEAWKGYLEGKKLCGRNPVQSFIEDSSENDVKEICSKSGRLVGGNLCISNNKISMYNVESTNTSGCKVTRVEELSQYVIVACNKVNNLCRPVHFEKYNNQTPGNKTCI